MISNNHTTNNNGTGRQNGQPFIVPGARDPLSITPLVLVPSRESTHPAEQCWDPLWIDRPRRGTTAPRALVSSLRFAQTAGRGSTKARAGMRAQWNDACLEEVVEHWNRVDYLKHVPDASSWYNDCVRRGNREVESIFKVVQQYEKVRHLLPEHLRINLQPPNDKTGAMVLTYYISRFPSYDEAKNFAIECLHAYREMMKASHEQTKLYLKALNAEARESMAQVEARKRRDQRRARYGPKRGIDSQANRQKRQASMQSIGKTKRDSIIQRLRSKATATLGSGQAAASAEGPVFDQEHIRFENDAITTAATPAEEIRSSRLSKEVESDLDGVYWSTSGMTRRTRRRPDFYTPV